jgi:hypothetical protein
VVLALAVIVAVIVGFALGGHFSALSELQVRAAWLIGIAIAVQIVAFPSGILPWHVGDTLATGLWVGSYGLLIAATLVNGQIPGMRFVAVGMGFNLAAILANGGHMPALPEAASKAGLPGAVNNSQTLADPHLAMLVDRWAAPGWVPLANVFSIGDVLLAVGAFSLVLPAMGVSLRRLLPARA